MNWRTDKITEKQKQMIAIIEENAIMNNALVPSFSGSTKGEASDYISKYLHESCLSAYLEVIHDDAGDRR